VTPTPRQATTTSVAKRTRRFVGPVPAILRGGLWAAALATMALGIASPAVAGASGSTSVATAQLTGTYNVSFHVVTPTADRRDKTTLSLGFTAECTSGACNVTVSTLANACPSGSCGQPPADLTFSTELLRLGGGEYKGTFTIKTGCTAKQTYFPYAYEQRTTLTIRPTAAQGAGESRDVSRFVGTLELIGSPDATGHKLGCAAYRYGLSVSGATET
jgi:hypothetical protein